MSNSEHTIGIFSPFFTDEKVRKRMNYVTYFIQLHCPSLRFLLVSSPHSSSFLIEYNMVKSTDSEYFIPFTTFLTRDQVEHNYEGSGEEMILFPDKEGNSDFYAAIFHTILRTEEYGSPEIDRYGRFLYRSSCLYRADAIKVPIVDIWIDRHLRKLKEKVDFQINYKNTLQFTCDIDVPWLYRHLKPDRYIKTFIKSLAKLDFNAIGSLLSPPDDDPYYTFMRILKTLRDKSLQGIFFLLIDGKNKVDLQNNLKDNPDYYSLLRRLGEKDVLGIHPSYETWLDVELMKSEIQLFHKWLRYYPAVSRQHYLHMRFPDTILYLDESGIKHDYTMAYAGIAGWRNGTSYPYRWYDLKQDEMIDITVHPLQFMDVTMTEYRDSPPAEAATLIEEMKAYVRRYGGEFTILWHNSFFYKKSEEWGKVFDLSLSK